MDERNPQATDEAREPATEKVYDIGQLAWSAAFGNVDGEVDDGFRRWRAWQKERHDDWLMSVLVPPPAPSGGVRVTNWIPIPLILEGIATVTTLALGPRRCAVVHATKPDDTGDSYEQWLIFDNAAEVVSLTFPRGDTPAELKLTTEAYPNRMPWPTADKVSDESLTYMYGVNDTAAVTPADFFKTIRTWATDAGAGVAVRYVYAKVNRGWYTACPVVPDEVFHFLKKGRKWMELCEKLGGDTDMARAWLYGEWAGELTGKPAYKPQIVHMAWRDAKLAPAAVAQTRGLLPADSVNLAAWKDAVNEQFRPGGVGPDFHYARADTRLYTGTEFCKLAPNVFPPPP